MKFYMLIEGDTEESKELKGKEFPELKKHLLETAANVNDPEIRLTAVFEKNPLSTNGLADELAHVDGITLLGVGQVMEIIKSRHVVRGRRGNALTGHGGKEVNPFRPSLQI